MAHLFNFVQAFPASAFRVFLAVGHSWTGKMARYHPEPMLSAALRSGEVLRISLVRCGNFQERRPKDLLLEFGALDAQNDLNKRVLSKI